MDALRSPPPLGDDQSVLVLPTSRQVPGFVVDRASDRLRDHFDVAVDRSPLLDATGGDRQVRVHPHLDHDALAANPTRFLGISDNTNLHCALAAAGLQSYYGGQALPGLALDPELLEYTATYLERALFADAFGRIEPAESYTDDRFDFEAGDPREFLPAPGWTFDGFTASATGRLWGGCLEVLEWVAAADPDGALVPDDGDGLVLLVETSEERPSATQVRRVLQTLGVRGTLSGLEAVVVGRPKTRHEDSPPIAEREAYRENQREAVRDTVRDFADAPICFDVDVGHTDPHAPLPLGARIELDPQDETITFT